MTRPTTHRNEPETPPRFEEFTESIPFEKVEDLDQFFAKIYQYYLEKGFWGVILRRFYLIITTFTTITVSSLLFLFVNWSQLYACENIDCAHVRVFKIPNPISWWAISITTIHGVLLLGWILFLLKLIYDVFLADYAIYRISRFVNYDLNINDHDLQQMKFSHVVEAIVRCNQTKKKFSVFSLSEQSIVGRIMRIENYLIGMVHSNVINLSITGSASAASKNYYYSSLDDSRDESPLINSRDHIPAFQNFQIEENKPWRFEILSETLLWNIRQIISHLFDSSFKLNEQFVKNPTQIRRLIQFYGIINLICAPFIFFFVIMRGVFKYAALLRKSKAGFLVQRRWSQLAKWRFRDFNEMPHEFENRLNAAYRPSIEFIEQFPNYHLSTFAKIVMTLASTASALIIIISILKNPLLLYVEFLGFNLIWWLGICLVVWSTAHSFVISPHSVLDPWNSLKMVIRYTHFYPDHWRFLSIYQIYSEFNQYFQHTFKWFLMEIFSVVTTPYMLLFVLPSCAESIAQFIDDKTIDTDIGHVCGMASFDFAHLKLQFNRPTSRVVEMEDDDSETPPTSPAPHGRSDKKISLDKDLWNKVERSVLRFKSSFPSWKGDKETEDHISQLASEQSLRQSQIMNDHQHHEDSEIDGSSPLTPPSAALSAMRAHGVMFPPPPSVMQQSHLEVPRPRNELQVSNMYQNLLQSHHSILADASMYEPMRFGTEDSTLWNSMQRSRIPPQEEIEMNDSVVHQKSDGTSFTNTKGGK